MKRRIRSDLLQMEFICRHSLEVSTSEQTYYMYADSEKDKDEWIGAIGRFDFLCLVTCRAIVHASLPDTD